MIPYHTPYSLNMTCSEERYRLTFLHFSDVCAESVRESGGKVLAFCRAGISRSAAICIAYLMQQSRMTMDEAHDYVKSRRAFISPNLNFMRQLHEFDGRLRADRARSTLDHLPPSAAGPSRPVLRSLQCPLIDNRRRWLSATPTYPVNADAAPRTVRRASAAPRCLDTVTRCCPEYALTVGPSYPAAALLSVISPGTRLGSISAPTVVGERSMCRWERLSASTPSQVSRRVFVYPLPLSASAKSSLISL